MIDLNYNREGIGLSDL